MDGRVVGEGERVITEALNFVIDGEGCDWVGQNGNGYFGGVGTLSVIIVDIKCDDIGTWCIVGVICFKSCKVTGVVAEVPDIG